MERRFEVWEDNARFITLAVFNNENSVSYIHTGFESEAPDVMREAMNDLRTGTDPAKEWDGNCGGASWEFGDNPQKIYDSLLKGNPDLIADNHGIYRDRFGASGKRFLDV